mmetsp:Transcript_16834/g.40003  ORF Transcript_16834/g.40003 Transcript_16834/m.40003 type:complete len:91 (+) Transcript_16834:123-395(+)
MSAHPDHAGLQKKARRVQIRLTAGAGVQIYAHRRAAADTGVQCSSAGVLSYSAPQPTQGNAPQGASDAGALPHITVKMSAHSGSAAVRAC